jgi:beta-glucosidase
MKTIGFLFNLSQAIIAFVLLSQCATRENHLPLYKNKALPVEKRVEDLLKRMTLDEKLAQLQFQDDTNAIGSNGIGSVGFLNNGLLPSDAAIEINKIQQYLISKTRLGIPAIKSGEAIFAYMGNKSTAFPQSIALASSWDTSLMTKVAEAISEEVRARGIRQVFAPVVNIARDSRWGRTGETFGEDPYLTSRMGVAYVKTFEKKGIITTPKHFAANMGMEGRFGAPVHFSERLLREIYFPGFKACFLEGGAKSVMMAYNTLDGIPCATNNWLMNDMIKGEWGFDGFIVSDGEALPIIYNAFGIYGTKKELSTAAINAGCDISISPASDGYYGEILKEAVKEGLVSEKRIDDAVRRVLRQKFRTGLFDNPFADPDYAERITDCAAHRTLALEAAREGIVLVKNDKNTLPLGKNVHSIALVGPLADWLLINHYGGFGRHEVTLLEGLISQYPDRKVFVAKGAEVSYMALPAIQPENFLGGIRGEYYNTADLSGKPVYVRTDDKIEFDWKEGSPEGLPRDNFSVRWTGRLKSPVSGTYRIGVSADDGVRLFIENQLVVDMWQRGSRRLKEAEYTFRKGRVYSFRMEYFDSGHRAFAQLGWNIDPLVLIPEAVKTAGNADAIVAVVGMKDDENGDRAYLELDNAQEQLILALAKTGKPLIVVIQTGTVIAMNNWIDKADAVMFAWYPGEEGGRAIAEILMGDVNPSAKLPVSIPKTTGQVPVNYNHLPYKPDDYYVGIGNEPQVPFGHGLSYTTFEYSNLRLSAKEIRKDENITVSVDIKNTGDRTGSEIVQLYIHDELASIARPVKELKGFAKIKLEPGELKTASFTITTEQLILYDMNMKPVVEPGTFTVMIGASSEDIRLTNRFSVIE